MSRFSPVLFDLDGTLIDHFEAIHAAYEFAQQSLDLPVASLEKVKATVGGSVPVTMRRLIGPDESEEVFEKALALFDEQFARVMLEQVSVLPGVPEVLAFLSGQGVPISVFTNKKGEHARAVLEHLDLARYFEAIIGASDTPFRKPQPEFTDHVLKTHGADPSQTLMIGDSPFDVEAGKVRGLYAAVVATGSHTCDQLQETEADWVFSDMSALGCGLFGMDPVRCRPPL